LKDLLTAVGIPDCLGRLAAEPLSLVKTRFLTPYQERFMLRTVPIKKLRASLCSQGIRIYLSEYGAVRIETNHYRCEMRPEEFLALLKKAAQQTT
jgi:hypothetical protein